jgi:hypothetical protein
MLSDALKLVWLEHYALDRVHGDGAYMGAGPMGQRLAKSRDAIDSARRELLRLRLLVAGDRARGKTGTYFPALPATCVPASERPAVETVTAATERLDQHIRQIRSAAPAPESAAPSAVSRGGTVPPPTGQSIGEGSRSKCRPGQGSEFCTVGEVLQPQVGELQNLQPQVGERSLARTEERLEELQAPRGPLRGPGTPETEAQPMGSFLNLVRQEIDRAEREARERRGKPPDRAAPAGDAEATCARCGASCERGPWPEQRCNRCALALGQQDGRADPSDEEARVAMRDGA